MPYPEFLKALKEKKVEGVVFQPPSGDVAFALIDGKSVRMGEGWPVEQSNSWSSPSWVVRILENEGVPYSWNFNLGVGTQKAKAFSKAYLPNKPYTPYVPDKSKTASVIDQAGSTGAAFAPQPKMYGGADTAMDTSGKDPDYAGLGLNK